MVVCPVEVWASAWDQAIQASSQAFQKGDSKAALEELSPALTAAQSFEAGDTRRPLTLNFAAALYLDLYDMKNAEDMCQRARAAWEKISPPDPRRSWPYIGLSSILRTEAGVYESRALWTRGSPNPRGSGRKRIGRFGESTAKPKFDSAESAPVCRGPKPLQTRARSAGEGWPRQLGGSRWNSQQFGYGAG
jgi:hypothetical protein